MMTSLRFKNWRSLRDVEITNLTPITVFIGANSSGKSNLLDGLYFLRSVNQIGGHQTFFEWGGYPELLTIGSNKQDGIELGFTSHGEVIKEYLFSKGYLGDNDGKNIDFHPPPKTDTFVMRWQMLDENFMPPLFFQMNPRDTYDYHLVERTARNVPLLLNYMQQNHAEVFEQLQQDLTFLLDYIDRLETVRDELGIRMVVREKAHQGAESPRISAGTARLIAVLTAMYTLDMRDREQAGLLVIEEPDASIHPLLLRRLIEVFRAYTERETPRQIILTTHNPTLLDYLKPEEIRLVERDESGFTTVKSVSPETARVWLEDGYTLGEAWLTRSLGGVPE